jgi:nitroreductase
MTLGLDSDSYGSQSKKLVTCLEAAGMAPSIHNSQPWRFRVVGDRIDVMLDRDRLLAAIDPTGREAWMSVGAAVLNLRVAILAGGRVPLTIPLPDPGRPDLAASIRLGGRHRPDATIRALFGAIPVRRTNRRPFRDIEVRAEVLNQLAAAARVEGATMVTMDALGRRSVVAIAETANSWQRESPEYMAELRIWTAVPFEARDGIPAHSFGPLDEFGALPLRDFGAAHPDLPRRQRPFEHTPTLVILYTTGDQPRDWLRAGQAMERVLLTATVRGVATTPISAPTEEPELRALLGDEFADHVAQVILRLGYGDPVPSTPRRPVTDFVELIEPANASR